MSVMNVEDKALSEKVRKVAELISKGMISLSGTAPAPAAANASPAPAPLAPAVNAAAPATLAPAPAPAPTAGGYKLRRQTKKKSRKSRR